MTKPRTRLKSLGKAIEREGKSLLRRTLIRALPKPRMPRRRPTAQDPMRILAVRHDARLGNLLLLTPALRLLKRAFPDARIDALISGRYGAALAFNQDAERVLTPAALPGIFLKGGYDLAFDFSPQHAFSLSSAAWTALSRAKMRVGFERGDAAVFLNLLVSVPQIQAHETANLCALVRTAAPWAPIPTAEELRPRWIFGPNEQEKGAELWRRLGLDGESLVFFLGGRAEKQLPVAWFLELTCRAANTGRKVVLAGGPAEAKLLSAVKIPENVLVAPEMPLRSFAAFLSCARAVVTADTGPMHLAAALGRPSLEIFTHTEPWRFGYGWLPGCRVLETSGRAPSIDEAWNALQGVLG
ncbi:MAG TPA: glycosyltransferase family 9 protein [Elusimicrobiota bacterium]|nr:glycosyltransferase family 9 protein [Elusimicrobiota bacterium]